MAKDLRVAGRQADRGSPMAPTCRLADCADDLKSAAPIFIRAAGTQSTMLQPCAASSRVPEGSYGDQGPRLMNSSQPRVEGKRDRRADLQLAEIRMPGIQNVVELPIDHDAGYLQHGRACLPYPLSTELTRRRWSGQPAPILG